MRGTGDPEGFAVGEVRAIRTFRLGRDGGLYPLYEDRAWQPGSNTAACKRGREHTAPASDCRCGFYAYGDLTWTVAQPPAARVLAVVALWGSLEVATRGVRAEHGRLQAVWLHRRVPDHLVQAVRARYPGVEVLRDRDALLQRHPLTALEGYRAPRLAGHRRQVAGWLLAVLAAVVVLIGCLPADQLIVNAPGAVLWTAAVAVVCLTLVAGLGMRSPAVGAAGMVGLGWMLTTTGNSAATVWVTRLPLLAGGPAQHRAVAGPGRGRTADPAAAPVGTAPGCRPAPTSPRLSERSPGPAPPQGGDVPARLHVTTADLRVLPRSSRASRLRVPACGSAERPVTGGVTSLGARGRSRG